VGFLYANFSLPRPLCSRLRPDVRDRQTSDVRQKHRLMPLPIRGGGIIISRGPSFGDFAWGPGIQPGEMPRINRPVRQKLNVLTVAHELAIGFTISSRNFVSQFTLYQFLNGRCRNTRAGTGLLSRTVLDRTYSAQQFSFFSYFSFFLF